MADAIDELRWKVSRFEKIDQWNIKFHCKIYYIFTKLLSFNEFINSITYERVNITTAFNYVFLS